MRGFGDADERVIKIQLRIVLLIEALNKNMQAHVSKTDIHAAMYFADALAELYSLEVLHPTILRTHTAAKLPGLDVRLNELIGRGVLLIRRHGGSSEARGVGGEVYFMLNRLFTDNIVALAEMDEGVQREKKYLDELTLALSGLGTAALESASLVDAAYGDYRHDANSLVALSSDRVRPISLAAAQQLAHSMSPSAGPAEGLNLYIRHLSRLLAERDTHA